MQTLQQAYNTVVIGLAAQGWRQSAIFNPAPQCRYRDPHGRKCAVGQLIPDELYSDGMEGDIAALYAKYPDLEPFLPAESVASQWQELHDDAVSPRGMLADFLDWGRQNDLTWPEGVDTELLEPNGGSFREVSKPSHA